jgi:cellulose synthase/poly-beta-1,6-N-acetylglucosamine synthase-like glycosyltransferase
MTSSSARLLDVAETLGPPSALDTRAVDREGGRAAEGTPVERVLTGRQQTQYIGLVAAWVVVNADFWAWWLQADHIGQPLLYALVSVASFYCITVLPSFYLFFLGWMRRPLPARVDDLAPGVVGQVAVITLTVPGSEAVSMVRRQLLAMRDMTHPHDSWILVDKVHSPEIAAMAAQLGVRYFCRHDVETWGSETVARWNAPHPPFQTKTKAGNVNAWLEAHGDAYTHFTQLDIDHRPVPGYLERVLGYFRNSKVAWVQAPSVYGNHEHWTARGSSEQEFGLQGPLQMGFFGFCRTPFIIGSHCTYDLQAIRDIGGFQPTRAEDHLDTVCLAAAGREGVYVPDVIAVGDGPESFDTYLAQQFAWAYSMIQVLFFHTPRLLPKYTRRQVVQFVFVQTWYTFWSLSTVALFMAPVLSLVFDAPVSHVNIWQYVLHSWPIGLVAAAVWLWSRSWHQPRGLSLSWRGMTLHVARWVIVLSALLQVLFRVRKPYMITRKGVDTGAARVFRLSLLLPYLTLIGLALASCWLYLTQVGSSSAQGMLFFALLESGLFAVLLAVVLHQDLRLLRASGTSVMGALRLRAVPVLVTVGVSALVLATVLWCAEPVWVAWTR